MKNKFNYLLLAFLTIGLISSCSKEEDEVDKDKINNPEVSTIETHTPPSGGYYSLAMYGDNSSSAVWTTDFLTFNKFTSEFEGVYNVKVENDTVLIAYSDIHQLNYIAYAPVNNLNGFKVISSREPIEEFSLLNGVIIVYSVERLNKYTGYCNLNQGMNSVVYYSTVSSNIEYTDFKNVGTAIIANHNNTNTGKNMAYTTDGMTWNVSATIKGGRFDRFDGKIWRFDYDGCEYTSDTDLSSATWISNAFSVDSLNTTDSSGSFFKKYLDVNTTSNWRYYGSLFNGTKTYFALNVSTDQGLTWRTQLLNSVLPIDNFASINGDFYSVNSLLVWNNINASNQFAPGVYTATNGVDFTLDNSQATIDKFNSFRKINYVR